MYQSNKCAFIKDISFLFMPPHQRFGELAHFDFFVKWTKEGIFFKKKIIEMSLEPILSI